MVIYQFNSLEPIGKLLSANLMRNDVMDWYSINLFPLPKVPKVVILYVVLNARECQTTHPANRPRFQNVVIINKSISSSQGF